MQLHHIGIAVTTLEEGAQQVRQYYCGQISGETEPVHDPLQEADLQLFELNDGSRIELVAGRPAQSMLGKGLNLHHVCYQVQSVEKAIDEWYQRGALVVSPPKPAVLFGGRMVAFVLTPLGLLEFLNEK
ncbi:MAG: VOC family protein [Proteobacteria bacterium]|nr:VOC family protein [Pseudomonadota bacterium]